MNACCNALACLLCAGIKQRQRFSCFLNRLTGLRDNLSFRVNTIKGVCEQLRLQIAVADPVNGQLVRCGVVVNFLDDIQGICSDAVISDICYLCAMWGALSKPLSEVSSVMPLKKPPESDFCDGNRVLRHEVLIRF